MIRSLYGKLTLAMVGLLVLTGGAFLVVSLWTTQKYIEEVNQKLHIDVADHLVEEVILIKDDQVNKDGLEHIFHMMMVINPGIEIYLLDPVGRVLAYSAPPGRVKAERVSLGPLKRFLAEEKPTLPLTGDDPRLPGYERAFSAARIGPADDPQGYLYVVLGGERYTSVVQLLGGSHILRLSVMGVVGVLVLAGLVGLIAFALLTARLRRLRGAMISFEGGGFNSPPHLTGFAGSGRGDELDDLAATFARLAEAMSHQLQRARGADVLRRELVANVSHDLRTPLASLTAFLETLLLKDRALPASEQRRYLEGAYRHSQSLGELVARLFELAKLEARQTEPEFEPFSPGELMQDVAQKFELKAKEHGVTIRLQTQGPTPFVWADLRLTERVLDNLIDNALRHTPAGGQVTLAATPTPRGVLLEVVDTGVGISAEDLPFVFDRYYRAETRGQDAPRRAGLGLAIAQHIAQLHGTQIAVASRTGCGARFAFELRADRTGNEIR